MQFTLMELIFRELITRANHAGAGQSTVTDHLIDRVRQIISSPARITTLQSLEKPEAFRYTCECVHSKGFSGGRPHFNVHKDLLSSLLEAGFKVSEIAKIVCVFRSIIFRRLLEYGMSSRGLILKESDIPAQDANLYYIHCNGPIPLDEDNEEFERVVIPQLTCDLPESLLNELTSLVFPLSESENYGIDLYYSAIDVIMCNL
uniref:Uncharacterized protein n=1 Tax=Amphimedon queenslandica TaxID=400682 RepID=A0A1X7UNC9_AMPQE